MLRKWVRCALALDGLLGARLHAQAPTGIPAVDSAAVARESWSRASAALASHDTMLARREIDRAAAAWPTQPAYVWGKAVMARLTSDTAGIYNALDAYVSLGLGRDLHNDARFSGLAALPRFARVIARHDSNRAPLVRSRVLARLGDSTFWPEGVDYDSRTGRYYVASVRHRTIAEVSNGTVVRELWPRDTPGIGAVMGLRVDPARSVLWATIAGVPQMHGYTPSDSGIAALVRVRIADGTIERRWDLPHASLGHVLGDLAIDSLGDVFISDSYDPVLYRLAVGGDSLERIVSPYFHSLQGIAPTRNGSIVYVADYSHGLLRVDVATHAVSLMEPPAGTTALGCDGIILDHGAIIAVQNGVSPARIMRFTLDASGTRITRAEVLDQNTAIADEPTIGTLANGEFVYVANGQWEKYDERGQRRGERPLTAPVLLAIPPR
jgi:hypothetical protein